MARKRIRLGAAILGLGTGLCLSAGSLSAQVGTGSSIGGVALAAESSGGLSVTLMSGTVQSIASILDNAVNPFPTPVQILTQWRLNPGQSNAVVLVAYFTNPAQALSTGTLHIPASWIEGRVSTGIPTAFTPISQGAVAGGAAMVGTPGGSLTLFSQPITGTNKTANRTDNLDLQLNLVGRTTNAGTYAGTLNIRAIVQ
jgi:hypothetical protein